MDRPALDHVRLLVGKFLAHLKLENFAERSIASYAGNLKPLISFLATQDAEDIHQVTRDTLYRYQQHIYQSQSHRGRAYGLATQALFLTAARRFFQFLAKRGHILSDPSTALELPRQKRPLPRGILTRQEVERLLAAPRIGSIKGLRDRVILELFYSTGIRASELANLRVVDVDAANQEVRVRGGKGGKDRMVPTGEVAARMTSAYVKEARPHFASRRREWLDQQPVARRLELEKANDLLFLGGNGRQMSRHILARLVASYARATKIKQIITPHNLRHTCATHMLRGGASLRHVQEMLGHASLLSTQVYTHVAIQDLKREHRRTHPREHLRPA